MTGDPTQILLDALLARRSSRRAPGGPAADFAAFLVAARRDELEGEPVSPGLRRRIIALAAASPGSAARHLARLVFDSWKTLAPAVRGAATTRLIRFEDPLGAIDVELDRTAGDGLAVRVALDEAEGVTEIRIEDRDGRVLSTAAPGPRAAAAFSLDAPPEALQVVVRGEAGEWFRSPAISSS